MAGDEALIAETPEDAVTGPMTVISQADAAQAFRAAVVRLAGAGRESDPARTAAREAAEALVDLARSGDRELLGQLLAPDLGQVTWSVACYQIGNLTPNALKNFADPVSALDTLTGCPNRSHVAAELVASTPSGVRWVALIRTGSLLSFQLPDSISSNDAWREHPGGSATAVRHWTEQVRRWAGDAGREATVDTLGVPSQMRSDPVDSAGLDEVLELVVAAMGSFERRERRQRQASAELLDRLDDIARRMSEFQASVEAEVGLRIHALASYVAEVAGAFADQQTSAVEHLEARFDQIAALLPTGARSRPFELASGRSEPVAPPPASG